MGDDVEYVLVNRDGFYPVFSASHPLDVVGWTKSLMETRQYGSMGEALLGAQQSRMSNQYFLASSPVFTAIHRVISEINYRTEEVR